MTERLPSLFVSHGPPSMVIDDLPVHAALADLGRRLPRPRAVVCVSAHWIAETPAVTAGEAPPTIHDFYGFPDELYRLHYPAPGNPDLAARIAALVREAGYPCHEDAERGLDHGTWEPLMLMYPEADVPVVQLSLLADPEPAAHYRLGRALAPLREKGVMVMGSGTAVHNLSQWRREPDTTPAWARAFDDWLAVRLAAGDVAAVLAYHREAPSAHNAHPTAEHFLPLPVALGAADGAPGEPVYRGFSYGSLSMAAYAFDGIVTTA